MSNLAAKHVQLEDTFADMVDRWRTAQIIPSDSTVASSPGLKLRTLTAQASSRTQLVKLSLEVSLHQHLQSEPGGKDLTLHPTRTGEWTRCRNWTFLLCPAKLEATRGLIRPSNTPLKVKDVVNSLKVLVILVVSFKILPVTKALQCLCSNLYIYSSFLFLFFCSASNNKHPFLTLAQCC